jgi:hypothetical protein
VAQHVNVHGGQSGSLAADALDEAIDGIGRERAAALGREDEGRLR